MSERKRKRPPETKSASLTPDTLKDTLGELAANIDSLVDNLTMGMPDPEPDRVEVVTEHQAEPETAPVSLARMAAAAPIPKFETAQPAGAVSSDEAATPVEAETAESSSDESSIANDTELADLAGGLIDAVENDTRDASGNRVPESAVDNEAVAQCPDAEEAEATETEDEACAPDVPADGDGTSIESAPEHDATTAGVIPWAAPEAATRSSAGGAMWKIAAALVAAGLLGGGWFYWNGRDDVNAQAAARPSTMNKVVPFTTSKTRSDGLSGVNVASIASLAAPTADATEASELPSEIPLTVVADPGPAATRRIVPIDVASTSELSSETPLTVVADPGPAATREIEPIDIASTSELSSETPLTVVADPGPAATREIEPIDIASTSELPEATVPLRVATAKTSATDVMAESLTVAGESETVRVAEAAAPVATPEPLERAPRESAEVVTNSPVEADPIVVAALREVEMPEQVPAPSDITAAQPLVAALSTDFGTEQEPDLPAETTAAPIEAPRDSSVAGGDSGAGETVFEPPKLVRRGNADYSERARKRGERGVVELLLLVAPSGSVKRVIIEQGMSGSELEASAISAALRSKYEPATSGGEPVEAWASERFVFEP